MKISKNGDRKNPGDRKGTRVLQCKPPVVSNRAAMIGMIWDRKSCTSTSILCTGLIHRVTHNEKI
jgi:hypothetical protein